jgi:hypothetical protein
MLSLFQPNLRLKYIGGLLMSGLNPTGAHQAFVIRQLMGVAAAADEVSNGSVASSGFFHLAPSHNALRDA